MFFMSERKGGKMGNRSSSSVNGGREKFGSRLGFILVSAGCAVGLGNVWKFPYICGMYGGAAFILMYLAFLVLLGLPIMICEFTIGRGSQRGMGKAFEELEPKGTKWHRLKWMSILGCYLLMMFYTMVGGWMLYYAYNEISGSISGITKEQVGQIFEDMLGKPDLMGFWALIAILVSFGVCALGLKNGVEKITKIMMSFLIVLMVVLTVHSVSLPDAGNGIKFYLVPDFDSVVKIGLGEAVFAAMSHAFFTLSIGIGSMEIFGSYLSKDRSITGEAFNIMLLDTFVALMAGFIIIPACFSFDVQPDAGPSLLFITLPNLFNSMAGGRIWGSMFFIFMSFAALSTIIAVFEALISVFMDVSGWSRKKSVAVNIVLVTVLSIPAIIGFNLISGFRPLGEGSTFMDLEDFIVSYNLLPLGSMVFVFFCVRKNGWGFDNFIAEANEGSGMKFPKSLKTYMTYVLPAVITVIYLKGYYDTFSSESLPVLIGWMAFAVVLLVLVFSVSVFTGKNKTK